MFAIGLFENGSAVARNHGRQNANVTSEAHNTAARELATAGTVLLQNKRSVLPLDPTAISSVAVIGGAAAMWGETMDDSDIDTIVWPDTAAVAERLWSPARFNNATEAFPRLANFHCHMVRRGVSAASLHPGSCWSIREIN